MITAKEYEIARMTLAKALEAGAAKVRLTYSRSEEELVATLNGQVDRISRRSDRALSLALFVDGKYGSFSTNDIEPEGLESFVQKAVETARTVAPDPCRDLPDPSRCCRDALTGLELGLVDPGRSEITPEKRIQTALDSSVFARTADGKDRGYSIISEEGEYSDSVSDTLLLDSNGTECRHSECSFDYGVETTIESGGEKYSGYWWDSSSRVPASDYRNCSEMALKRAAAHIGASPAPGETYNLVLDSEVASRFVSPLLKALNAFSIQQNNSFLMDSLGKQVFPEGLTLIDCPRIPGQACSKFFDSEGVATKEGPIIEKGVVKEYFVNTYMSRKLGIAPTAEAPVRPKLLPWPAPGLKVDEILGICGDGILVTDFNGGNSNAATGDFSYGIEGFLFRDGKIVRPVSEMLVTGNFISLWNNLIAAGEDARPCMSKLIPTLAFSNVDFSG